MDKYVVNNEAQNTGEHEVHKEGCIKFPSNYTSLGYFATCHEAVIKAKEIFNNVDGCAFCSAECHTR